MNNENIITVATKVLSDKIYYNGDIIITYLIKYPYFASRSSIQSLEKINSYYNKRAEELLTYINTELLESAKSDYEFRKQNSYPVNSYEVDLSYNITYNQNNILSLYMDQYEYAGGAHGNTIRRSDTWNLLSGNKIPLESIFPNTDYVKENIITQIDYQIKNEGKYYFDNYPLLVHQTFNPESFYLVAPDVVIYFQAYDLAPYASGILEFKIPI